MVGKAPPEINIGLLSLPPSTHVPPSLPFHLLPPLAKDKKKLLRLFKFSLSGLPTLMFRGGEEPKNLLLLFPFGA